MPHPRARSLRPGSNKEETVRRYVEERLAIVNRRYVKKHGNAEPGDDVIGYKSFTELCKDLHNVIDVLWLSGTREDISLENRRCFELNAGTIADSVL